jgi:hypothetical protein
VMRYQVDGLVQVQTSSTPAIAEPAYEAPQPGLMDDFRFGRFFRICSYWGGVLGGAAGVIMFVVFTFVKPLEPELLLMDQLVRNGLFFLLQVPLLLLVMGAAFALLYYLPIRLFLRVMRNRGTRPRG